MVLFVSDMHFGRKGAGREVEADLVAMLRACEADVTALYLVGDVFDHFVEYRHVVPKGHVRLLGLLAAWADRGVPITYLLGNHDPWHLDYFETEIGVRIVRDHVETTHYGMNVWVGHGDALDFSSRLGRRLRPVLRHPVPVTLYRNLLPGDAGQALARFVSRHFSSREPDAETAVSLRIQARRLLHTTSADLVVMGHSHTPEWHPWPEGTYGNTGAWYLDRTFIRLDATGARLLRWHDHGMVAYLLPSAT